MAKQKVILRRYEDYGDPRKLESIISEGLEELKPNLWGKVLVKPNVIFAHKRYGTTGYTHPSAIRALLTVLGKIPAIKELILGERCAVWIPTRYCFSEAGYSPLARLPKVRFTFFDEEKKLKVNLSKATIHKTLRLPRTVVEADCKVYAPKLKHHVSTKLTCALKLNIGILDSKERLNAHDYRLEEKIADLLEPGNPNFIVVDAVNAGQQNELVPKLRHVGAIMMGINSVAVDAIAARILGFEPTEVNHLRIVHERGYGPIALEDIEISGDLSLAELKEKCKNLDRTYSNLKEVDTPMRFFFGHYPDGKDYCHTGCLNMLKTLFAIAEANTPGALKKARPIAIVVGEYDGDVDGAGEKVILVGDCTKVSGKIKGSTTRVRGCPVTVPFFMITYCYYAGIKSPYMDPRAMFSLPFMAGISYSKKLYHAIVG